MCVHLRFVLSLKRWINVSEPPVFVAIGDSEVAVALWLCWLKIHFDRSPIFPSMRLLPCRVSLERLHSWPKILVTASTEGIESGRRDNPPDPPPPYLAALPQNIGSNNIDVKTNSYGSSPFGQWPHSGKACGLFRWLEEQVRIPPRVEKQIVSRVSHINFILIFSSKIYSHENCAYRVGWVWAFDCSSTHELINRHGRSKKDCLRLNWLPMSIALWFHLFAIFFFSIVNLRNSIKSDAKLLRLRKKKKIHRR